MKIDRINKGDWGKTKAFFDVKTSEGFTMKGFKLVEGVNGLFVSFPSQKGKDGEYRDTVWADHALKDELLVLSKSEYDKGEGDNPPLFLEEEKEVNEFDKYLPK